MRCSLAGHRRNAGVGAVTCVLLLTVACFAHTISGHAGHDHSALVEPIFKQLEVVPDVLDAAPAHWLTVTYPNATAVTYGDPLTPTQVKDTPTVEWPAADADSFYTLIMTDPDAPSRHAPELREWQHWTVVNIPGANLTAGDTLTEYVGAGPPKGTGLHRYVFLLFKQQHQHAFGEPLLKRTDANRTHFNTRAFAEKHQLGAAVAGNLFQAEYDDYVPTLYAQFE